MNFNIFKAVIVSIFFSNAVLNNMAHDLFYIWRNFEVDFYFIQDVERASTIFQIL